MVKWVNSVGSGQQCGVAWFLQCDGRGCVVGGIESRHCRAGWIKGEGVKVVPDTVTVCVFFGRIQTEQDFSEVINPIAISVWRDGNVNWSREGAVALVVRCFSQKRGG